VASGATVLISARERAISAGAIVMYRRLVELVGRVAVVTGAASGIGLAISERFVAEGMRVMLSDLDLDSLDEAVNRLGAAGGDVHGVVADVADPTAVDDLAAAVIDRFGGLHVAVNNAGIVNRGYSWELSLEEWHRVVGVDLWGVIHGVRSFVPLLLASGGEGHVVNIASMAAVHVLPRLGPYTVAKHGVLGLSDVLRAEFAELGAPIGVSVVMPGRVLTRMNPIGLLPAAAVAANVVDAIRRDRAYVFTDDEAAEAEERLTMIIAARADVVRLDSRPPG
jgi:NAD(P)-dependent dehydrogenase (short-subunit alcohol dehydrogenase family)